MHKHKHAYTHIHMLVYTFAPPIFSSAYRCNKLKYTYTDKNRTGTHECIHKPMLTRWNARIYVQSSYTSHPKSTHNWALMYTYNWIFIHRHTLTNIHIANTIISTYTHIAAHTLAHTRLDACAHTLTHTVTHMTQACVHS